MSIQHNDDSAPPHSDTALAMRQRAEAMLAAAEAGLAPSDIPADQAHVIHELHVHQIELELQNEELRRTQEQLEIARERYFNLYELAPVSYITLNDQGLVQEANLTTATVLGVPRSGLIKRPLALFVAREDRDRYYHYCRALTDSAGPHVCELRMLRPDQSPFWARLETTSVPVASGSALVYRTVLIDITARVQAEVDLHELNAVLEQRVDERTAALRASEEHLRHTNADLERALRLKDEFLAMMSHELRTPLSIILSQTESLIEELYGPISVPQGRALATVAQGGRHLLALLSDILDLARIAVGQEKLDIELIDITQICELALHMVQPAAHTKGLQLSHMVAPGIVGLYADERRLTQILVNLLNNAVKFTPAGGSVALEVTADATHGQIQFSVWDSGVGIAPEDQERIFEPFIQADARLAREYEGIGLGLALVQRLVELHNGSISLVSSLGQGSRFTVSLPWSEEQNIALTTDPNPLAAPVAWVKPPRIVIADDDELTLHLYKDLLTRYGCQVLSAQTGKGAIAQIRASRPDAVVLDIQMPDLDGLAVIRYLRSDPDLATLPVIALTALAMPGDRERCLSAGATIYLSKPVSLHTLIAAITSVIAPNGHQPIRQFGT